MKFTFAIIFLSALIFNGRMNAEARVIQEKDANAETSEFGVTNQDVFLPQDNTPEYSPYDLAWQALHMAAAAACRGSTSTGGSGRNVNAVLNRTSRESKSCTQLCAETKTTTHCDAEASIYGKVGKATANGQSVGWFYNFKCDGGQRRWGGNEASAPEEDIMRSDRQLVFSFCCCRE